MKKKVLVLGSGGREHALAWKLAASPSVEWVWVAPGNAGTALDPGISNLDLPLDDFSALSNFCVENAIDLTIVGPEAPLVEGIVDHFSHLNLPIFGPDQAAAQLEGSKTFCKDFLKRHNIPTAAYASFTQLDPALAYVREMGAPIVVKADGLAAGKGVVVAETVDAAEQALHEMLGVNRFGAAGSRVVIEEYLAGEEASFIVMADGSHILPMATSQDHKRIGDGDTGPNTGGMGAYSPAPVVTEEVHARIMREVMEPTIRGMAAEGHPYVGFLYAGLMIMPDGSPKVIEFNCRFGDPETQPIMLRLQSDLAELCLAAVYGRLDSVSCDWDTRTAVGVVMAAGGYPGEYDKGRVIHGLDQVDEEGVKVFHAGTRLDGENVVTTGGRVLCVTALGDRVSTAAALAYQNLDRIDWQGAYARRDIGWRAIAREG